MWFYEIRVFDQDWVPSPNREEKEVLIEMFSIAFGFLFFLHCVLSSMYSREVITS